MRKALIVALGIAGLLPFVGVQTAHAEIQRICQDHYKIFWSGISDGCTAANHCKSYPIQGGLGFKNCFDINVPPKPTTGPWVPGGPQRTTNELKNLRLR